MSGEPEAPLHVNKTLYKNAVDQALACLVSPLAHRVVEILKNSTDDWWEEKVCNNSKVRENLHSPLSSDEEDRIGVLQITSCCELVFKDIGKFRAKWGDRCRGLISLVREARNESSHRPVREPDFSREDAEYYLYAIYLTAEMIKADTETQSTLKWIHERVWLGEVPSYPPVEAMVRGSEPMVSDVVPYRGVSRWFDDDGLREEVGSMISAIGEDEIQSDFERRILDETSLSETGWRGWVCMYHDSTEGIVDEPVSTLVFLPCEGSASAHGGAGSARALADRIMATSGKGPRVNRNMLFFVYAEPLAHDRMKRRIREYLALRHLMEEGAGGRKIVSYVADADDDARRWMRVAYSGVLVPDSGWGMYQPLYRSLELKGGNIVRAAVSALSEAGMLYASDAASAGDKSRFRLSDLGWPSPEADFTSIGEMWATLSEKTDFPIMESSDVLRHAIWCDVRDGLYGYADDVRVEYRTTPRPGFRPRLRETPDGEERVYPYPVCEGLCIEGDVTDVRMDGYLVTREVALLNGWRPLAMVRRDALLESGGFVGGQAGEGEGDERRFRRAVYRCGEERAQGPAPLLCGGRHGRPGKEVRDAVLDRQCGRGQEAEGNVPHPGLDRGSPQGQDRATQRQELLSAGFRRGEHLPVRGGLEGQGRDAGEPREGCLRCHSSRGGEGQGARQAGGQEGHGQDDGGFSPGERGPPLCGDWEAGCRGGGAQHTCGLGRGSAPGPVRLETDRVSDAGAASRHGNRRGRPRAANPVVPERGAEGGSRVGAVRDRRARSPRGNHETPRGRG